MDDYGFISIEYLFYIFLLILIAIGILFIANSSLNSSQNIEKHLSIRIVIDEISDDINQVNSNGEGYSKRITLPKDISGNHYQLKVFKNHIILKCNGKTAKSNIMPLTLIENQQKVNSLNLYPGNDYIVKKYENSQISITKVL